MLRRILAQYLWRVVLGVQCNTQKLDLRFRLGAGFQRFFNLSEVVGHQRAIVGQWTTRVDESQHDDATAILMEPNPLAVLIDEFEIRNLVARFWLDPRRRLTDARWIDRLSSDDDVFKPGFPARDNES